MYTQATNIQVEAEGSLHWQEGVAYRRSDSEGLQVLGSRSLGLLKFPWDSDAQQDCRKQKGQGSTNHQVDW